MEAQLEEFQVLQSIYGDDIQQVSPTHDNDHDDQTATSNNLNNLLSFRLKIPSLIERQIITSVETDHLYHLFQTGLILNVEFPSEYPESDVPLVKIQSAMEKVFVYCPPEMYEEHEEFKEMRRVAKEIQDKEIEDLTEILNNKARDSIGQVVMFILIQDIEDFLMEKSSTIKDFDSELANKGNDIKKPKVKSSNLVDDLEKLERTVLSYKKDTKKGYYAFVDSFFSSLSFTKECVQKKKGMERLMATSCNMDSKVYTWGGVCNGALTNDMFEVSLEDGKNIIVKKAKQHSLCTPRLFHSFNGMKNGFVIIGGLTDPKTYSSDICTGRIMSAGIEWQTAGKLASPICGHASCVHDNRLYTFGGYGKSGYSNDFNCYEWHGGYTSFEKIGSLNSDVSPRAGAAMVQSQGKIFIFGGHNEGQIFNDMYHYDIETNHWSRKTSQTNFVPHLTMATLLVRDSNTLVLYGGFDGSNWNSNMFEYNITENKWLIVPSVSDMNFDNAASASSIQSLTDSYVLFGGSSSPSLTFNSYGAFLNRVLFQKKSFTSEYSVRSFRSDKILKSEKSAVVTQSERYFKWFESTQPDDADLVFIFSPEEEESEGLTEREKLPCCAHKLVLQRFPELKKMIMISELKKLGLDSSSSSLDSYELNHGDLTYIRINYIPEVKNLKRAFIRVLQYIYSGMFDAVNLTSEHFKDIYQIALYFKMNLLVQSLLREPSLSSFLSNNFKTLEKELPTFLKIKEGEDVEDVEEFKSKLYEDSIPEVKQGLVRILAPDHTHDPPIFRSIYVHKMILCIASKYFAATFNSQFFEAQKRILIMDSMSIQSLIVVLSFIYCPGYPLDLNSGNAVEIYVSSHLLELPMLQDKARATIKQFEFDEYTALHILEISNEFGDAALQDYCFFLLARNYDEILQRDPQIFDELTPEQRVNIYKKHLVQKAHR